MWHVTCDMWYMEGGEHSLKISGSISDSLGVMMSCDKWNMTCDKWHLTHHTWHVTCDMWYMEGGEHCLKFSAPELLRFERDSVWKIYTWRITQWVTYWISDRGVCRTSPATPSLLNMFRWSPQQNSKHSFNFPLLVVQIRGGEGSLPLTTPALSCPVPEEAPAVGPTGAHPQFLTVTEGQLPEHTSVTTCLLQDGHHLRKRTLA